MDFSSREHGELLIAASGSVSPGATTPTGGGGTGGSVTPTVKSAASGALTLGQRSQSAVSSAVTAAFFGFSGRGGADDQEWSVSARTDSLNRPRPSLREVRSGSRTPEMATSLSAPVIVGPATPKGAGAMGAAALEAASFWSDASTCVPDDSVCDDEAGVAYGSAFLSLAPKPRPGGEDAGSSTNSLAAQQHDFRACSVRLAATGITVDFRAADTPSNSTSMVPWKAVEELRVESNLPTSAQPPSTHPFVACLDVSVPGEQSRAMLVALPTRAQAEGLARAGKARLRQAAATLRLRKASDLQSVPASSAAPEVAKSAVTAALLAKEALLFHGLPKQGGRAGRVARSASAPAVPGSPAFFGEGSASGCQVHDELDTSLSGLSALNELLKSIKPEDTVQPDPLSLSPVWAHVPPGAFFRKSSLCLDKLGLSLCPLATAGQIGARRRVGGCHRCAEIVQELPIGVDDPVGDVELGTEMLSFPISSVAEVAEESEFVEVDGDGPTAAGATAWWRTQAVGGSSTVGPPPGAATVSAEAAGGGPLPPVGGGGAAGTGAAASAGGAGGGLLRSTVPPPFARSPPPASEIGSAMPPTPHRVVMRIKAALAGRGGHPMNKQSAKMRLQATPAPPIVLALCFRERDEALRFISTLLAFKKYHTSAALAARVGTLAAEVQRRRDAISRAEEVKTAAPAPTTAASFAAAIASAAASATARPMRPPHLPPSSRLPRMVTNDEGEVFWYIPRQRPQPAPAAPPAPAPPSAPGDSGLAPSLSGAVAPSRTFGASMGSRSLMRGTPQRQPPQPHQAMHSLRVPTPPPPEHAAPGAPASGKLTPTVPQGMPV